MWSTAALLHAAGGGPIDCTAASTGRRLTIPSVFCDPRRRATCEVMLFVVVAFSNGRRGAAELSTSESMLTQQLLEPGVGECSRSRSRLRELGIGERSCPEKKSAMRSDAPELPVEGEWCGWSGRRVSDTERGWLRGRVEKGEERKLPGELSTSIRTGDESTAAVVRNVGTDGSD